MVQLERGLFIHHEGEVNQQGNVDARRHLSLFTDVQNSKEDSTKCFAEVPQTERLIFTATANLAWNTVATQNETPNYIAGCPRPWSSMPKGVTT